MNFLNRILLTGSLAGCLVAVLSLSSCHRAAPSADAVSNDWSDTASWYRNDVRMTADVFYVYSTNILAARDSEGRRKYRSAGDSTEHGWMTTECAYVNRIFGDSLNFYAPYYHQYTLESILLPADSFNVVYEGTCGEICQAFDYYLAHFNEGRPFILAGFSQGAQLLPALLKHMDAGTYSRMVAAYAMGIGITQEECTHPFVRPAEGPLGWGGIISFNTVMTPESIWPFVQRNSVACINPLNWRTDATPATLVFGGDTATVKVDTLHHVLVAEGLDPEAYIFAPLNGYCPKGNLHHWDLLFYEANLRRNALDRLNGPHEKGGEE